MTKEIEKKEERKKSSPRQYSNPRLLDYLACTLPSCYNLCPNSGFFFPQDDGEKVALGEKFGFRVNGPGKQAGADFPVGGSSIVFNIDLVELMMDPR